MDIYEITGYRSGVSREGVNYLQPADSFQNIQDGFIHRQVLQSRKGFTRFGQSGLSDETRVMGIFEWIKTDTTVELIACSKDFLYTFNTSTLAWDQISMAGSAPGGGFNVSVQDGYVSFASYPDQNGNDRVIFCSYGMSDVYYYDGTDVRSFTQDAPDFTNPTEGTLTKAHQVFNFNAKLNFWFPTLGGQDYPQAMIFSADRTTGNGDKFDVSGSGTLYAESSSLFRGAAVLGDTMVAAFRNSLWAVEKTIDTFNPYRIRRIASPLGSDATFSLEQWDDRINMVGKTGIISTDGRQALRADNKIPYFTSDEIEANTFSYTYGGFDRENAQFLWAYVSNDETTGLDSQDKVLVYNYEESSWSIFNARFSCFGSATTGKELTWDQIDETIDPSWERWDSTEDIWDKIGVDDKEYKTLAGDNEGYIWQLNTDRDDDYFAITGISQASSAVVTIGDHTFKVGDLVTISGVEGMTEINNYDADTDTPDDIDPYEVTAIGATTITINVDSTNFTAYTQNGWVSKPIRFYAETVPFNPYRDQGRKCHISHIEILMNTTGSCYLDILLDEENTPFKINVPMIPNNFGGKPRQWITVAINQEAEFFTFVIRKDSVATPLSITSMRIHAQVGGLTSA